MPEQTTQYFEASRGLKFKTMHDNYDNLRYSSRFSRASARKTDSVLLSLYRRISRYIGNTSAQGFDAHFDKFKCCRLRFSGFFVNNVTQALTYSGPSSSSSSCQGSFHGVLGLFLLQCPFLRAHRTHTCAKLKVYQRQKYIRSKEKVTLKYRPVWPSILVFLSSTLLAHRR